MCTDGGNLRQLIKRISKEFSKYKHCKEDSLLKQKRLVLFNVKDIITKKSRCELSVFNDYYVKLIGIREREINKREGETIHGA